MLSLDTFDLGGDQISDYLFGLAKRPSFPAQFPKRGVPTDGSRLMQLLVDDNDAFIAKYGEGNFGYTRARLDEIDRGFANSSAPPVAASPWRHVLATVEQLAKAAPIAREHWRVIVCANW